LRLPGKSRAIRAGYNQKIKMNPVRNLCFIILMSAKAKRRNVIRGS